MALNIFDIAQQSTFKRSRSQEQKRIRIDTSVPVPGAPGIGNAPQIIDANTYNTANSILATGTQLLDTWARQDAEQKIADAKILVERVWRKSAVDAGELFKERQRQFDANGSPYVFQDKAPYFKQTIIGVDGMFEEHWEKVSKAYGWEHPAYKEAWIGLSSKLIGTQIAAFGKHRNENNAASGNAMYSQYIEEKEAAAISGSPYVDPKTGIENLSDIRHMQDILGTLAKQYPSDDVIAHQFNNIAFNISFTRILQDENLVAELIDTTNSPSSTDDPLDNVAPEPYVSKVEEAIRNLDKKKIAYWEAVKGKGGKWGLRAVQKKVSEIGDHIGELPKNYFSEDERRQFTQIGNKFELNVEILRKALMKRFLHMRKLREEKFDEAKNQQDIEERSIQEHNFLALSESLSDMNIGQLRQLRQFLGGDIADMPGPLAKLAGLDELSSFPVVDILEEKDRKALNKRVKYLIESKGGKYRTGEQLDQKDSKRVMAFLLNVIGGRVSLQDPMNEKPAVPGDATDFMGLILKANENRGLTALDRAAKIIQGTVDTFQEQRLLNDLMLVLPTMVPEDLAKVRQAMTDMNNKYATNIKSSVRAKAESVFGIIADTKGVIISGSINDGVVQQQVPFLFGNFNAEWESTFYDNRELYERGVRNPYEDAAELLFSHASKYPALLNNHYQMAYKELIEFSALYYDAIEQKLIPEGYTPQSFVKYLANAGRIRGEKAAAYLGQLKFFGVGEEEFWGDDPKKTDNLRYGLPDIPRIIQVLTGDKVDTEQEKDAIDGIRKTIANMKIRHNPMLPENQTLDEMAASVTPQQVLAFIRTRGVDPVRMDQIRKSNALFKKKFREKIEETYGAETQEAVSEAVEKNLEKMKGEAKKWAETWPNLYRNEIQRYSQNVGQGIIGSFPPLR